MLREEQGAHGKRADDLLGEMDLEGNVLAAQLAVEAKLGFHGSPEALVVKIQDIGSNSHPISDMVESTKDSQALRSQRRASCCRHLVGSQVGKEVRAQLVWRKEAAR
jgi:hypothetical protein